ncbi:putative ribonuclease H-like domain-containing protein [Tanacetum coccineum]|uniref:Ribonuclease H-like domain-containing protein n=1 Tax=Tanacetum coccineum TaxID=301880 RepID=A0ABQ4Y5Y4_9ASTR
MRPLGCLVTILNTLDSLSMFDGKSDEGFFVGYSLSSKAFRVYNTRTKRVEENLHIGFLENKLMIEETGPKWLFDIDSLIQSMNYVPVSVGTVSNVSTCISEGNSQECIVMPIWKDTSYFDSPTENVDNGEPKTADDAQKQDEDGLNNENNEQEWFANDSSSKDVNAIGQQVNTASLDNNNVQSTVSDRRMLKPTSEQGFLSDVYEQKIHDTLNTCLYACFLSQIDPKSIAKALSDSSWVEAMQEELLQFNLQQVWILVDLPNGKTGHWKHKGVFRNKKDERGIMIRNKARLVVQGHRQEEGIDYEEVFAPVVRIEAIRLFLAYDSFMGFLVYQIDVNSTFLYGTLRKDVYVISTPGFKDPDHPDKVYKVVKALYGLHQAPKAWYETLANYLLSNGLQVQQKEDGIFISQDKYVAEILKKFNYSDVKSALTPVDLEKPLVKDGDADDVDVHLYRSMILSLMYLTASRPDIMFVVSTLDKKSTNWREDVVLGNRLIYWLVLKSKTKTVVATSTTEAEYVAVASCFNTARQKITTARQMLMLLRLNGHQSCKCFQFLSLEALFEGRFGDVAVHKELGEQMATAKVQTVNEVRQLQALVDKKRVIVTESSIRRDLHLDDAEGTDCLPTATIFEELARMGYEKPSQKLTFYKAFFSPQWKYFIHTITQCLSAKSTAWNEFSSSMASLIICLATNQKFNLSKYIFDAMVKHLDGGVKFLLYPRFLQVFINQQLGNMSTHKKIFVNPFHTKKVFANMKRAGKDFSGRITPLFDTMMVQPIEEIEVPQDKAEHEESVPTPSNDPQPSGEDSMQLTELMVLCTKLQTQVLDLQKAKDAQAKEIAALKKRIQRLERRKISRPTGLKRLRKVGMSQRVESSKDQESLGVPEDASKQGRSIADIDA